MKNILTKIASNRRSIEIIEKSETFDHRLYLVQARQKKIKVVDPVAHYVKKGWKIGLKPHSLFDTEKYLKLNPDIKHAKINAFAHYLKYGYFENRVFSDGFSIADYIRFNPELTDSPEHPLTHFNRVFGSETAELLTSSDDEVFGKAIVEGYFDYKWYLQTYNRFFPSPLEAFKHYLRVAQFSPINPSRKFDSIEYYRGNMDVYVAGQNPLKHFLKFGENEKRRLGGNRILLQPNNPVDVEQQISENACLLNVAFCLHIFYADYVELFAAALHNFPISVDLYVAVSSKDLAAVTASRFSSHRRVKRLIVKVVPNRGRNFGPLLVEFAAELRTYDLLCHLHSKKSLYSGREQTQWANYLIEYLINDPSVVTQALNIFAADEKVGLYCPTTFWLMPPWVNHVLRNRSSVLFWADMLGIEVVHDFLAYPVGGMFWARPSAVKQLLDRPFRYEDFPEEPLPNDGSMLHGLERVIGGLAEKNGFTQLFYYPDSGKFSEDKNYIFSAYRDDEQLLGNLREVDCISFDLFDTLVRREYTAPDYAKLRLGKELVERGLISSPAAFVTLRNNTESELRKEKNFLGDVGIDEIYRALADKLDLATTECARLMQREFELDLAMIQPKDEMVEMFNLLVSGGKDVWIISDTYYLRDHITQMLGKVGISGRHRLLISSEAGLRKDNGTMWSSVKQYLADSKIDSYIHIGDNVVSDAQLPGDQGLRTLHILHPMDKWHALGFLPSKPDFVDENAILKWGKLVSRIGRYPWLS